MMVMMMMMMMMMMIAMMMIDEGDDAGDEDDDDIPSKREGASTMLNSSQMSVSPSPSESLCNAEQPTEFTVLNC